MKNDSHAIAQALHDLGGALWFGGSVAGIAGFNKAGADLPNPVDRIRVANSAWTRFGPVQWAAIAAHLAGSVQITRSNKRRISLQHGYGRVGTVNAGLTVAGIAATAYASFTGQRIGKATKQALARGQQVDTKDATVSTDQTPPEIAKWQKQNRVAQYLVPVLVGGNVVTASYLEQLNRPGATATGVVRRLLPFV